MSMELPPSSDIQYQYRKVPRRRAASSRGEQVALLLLVSLVAFLFIISEPVRPEGWRNRKNG